MSDDHKKLAEEIRREAAWAYGCRELRLVQRQLLRKWADRIEALGGEQAEECQVRAGEGTLTASPPAPVANCKHCGHMAYAHAQGEQPFQYVEEGFKCWAEKCDCPGYEAETRECQ